MKVATKFGRDGAIFPDNYTERGLRDCVEASRKRLGVEKIDLLQLHCIPIEELKKAKQYEKIWQAFAALLPVKSVGVMGDSRTYQYIISLRAVTSVDGMTAD
ncbi:hypothetical protein LCGC14_1498880, partial [marine sediment metagenome]